MSDLRDSGAIEQDADLIYMLYRQWPYKNEEEYKNVAEVNLVKHRNGPIEQVLLSFEESNNRNAAEALIGSTLYFPEDSLPKLEEGRFYYFEVVGYRIVDKRLGELGIVSGFYDGPAQDILAMEYQGKEVLIPITDHFVLTADHSTKQILTSLPEGLLESYLED